MKYISIIHSLASNSHHSATYEKTTIGIPRVYNSNLKALVIHRFHGSVPFLETGWIALEIEPCKKKVLVVMQYLNFVRT